MEIQLKVCFSFLVHLATHLSIAGADFSTQPDSQPSTCVGTDLPLDWTINNEGSISTVVWSFNAVGFAVKVGSGTPFYSGTTGITAAKVEYTTSGKIVIKNPVVADSGKYSCLVTYSGGITSASSTATVSVVTAPSDPTCTHTGNTYTCATDSTSATVTIKIDDVDKGTNTYTGSGVKSVKCCLSGYAVQCRDDTSDTEQCKLMPSCSPGTTVSPSTTTTTPGTTATNTTSGPTKNTTSGPTKNTTSGPTNHTEGSTTNTISSTTASSISLPVSVIIAISAGGGLVILVGITIAIVCYCKRKSNINETVDDKHRSGIDNHGIDLNEHSNRGHHL